MVQPLFRSICRILLGILWLCYANAAPAAAPAFPIREAIDEAPLGTSLRYWMDESGKASLQDILSLSDSEWTLSNIAVPSFGFTQTPTWFNGRLVNETGQAQSYLLELGYTTLDDVQIHVLRNAEVSEFYHTGDLQPFGQRPVYNRNYLVPLQLQPGEQVDLFYRIETQGAVSDAVAIAQLEQLQRARAAVRCCRRCVFWRIADHVFL